MLRIQEIKQRLILLHRDILKMHEMLGVADEGARNVPDFSESNSLGKFIL